MNIKCRGRVAGLVLVVSNGLLPLAWSASFEHTLVLRQGDVPLLDGVPVGSAFTGFTDTYVDSLNSGTSYFSADTVRFGAKGGATDTSSIVAPTTRGYLAISGWESLLPAGAAVTSSKLGLTSAGTDVLGAYNGYLRYRTASFSGITWSTAGATPLTGAGSQPLATYGSWNTDWTANNQQTIDITQLTRQWQTGALANNGIQFVGLESSYWSGRGQQFYSSDYTADTTKRPTVTIKYVAPDSTPLGGGWSDVRTNHFLTGATVFQDTFIKSTTPTTANGSATVGTLEEWTNEQHPLLKILTTGNNLTNLAVTGESIYTGRPRLQSARLLLQLNGSGSDVGSSFRLLKLSQSWDAATATWNTRDGSTAWSPSWVAGDGWTAPTEPVSGVAATGTDPSFFDSPTLSLDITTLLQGYIDGGVNNGLVLSGSSGQWASSTQWNVFLTEYNSGLYQPVLVYETLQAVIPEPSTVLLFLSGAGLVWWRRRQTQTIA